MEFKQFNYKTKEDLVAEAARVNADIPFSDDISVLLQPGMFCDRKLGNSIVLQPVEGCDADAGGKPSELTRHRYMNFAEGGAGLIWFEATAIVPDGRAQARQLMMTRENMDDFKRLVDQMKSAGLKRNGYAPVIIQQLTHSGRYSHPNGPAEPWIARNNPLLEKQNPIPAERIISDQRLQELEQRYYEMARLSEQAGFDGADIKACHGYLGSELLASFTRTGCYGGSYENRTRFLKNSLRAARAATEDCFIITSRLSLSDCFPYPYGFGVCEIEGSAKPDLTETLRLIGEMRDEIGIRGLNVSIASPYVNPHVSRPYNRGGYVPDEHPLEGIARFVQLVRAAQQNYPEITMINAGFSFLREFAPNVAAGALSTGAGRLAGFGRALLANPDMPHQLARDGFEDKKRVCVACSLCTDHLRQGRCAGCFVRDREFYHD